MMRNLLLTIGLSVVAGTAMAQTGAAGEQKTDTGEGMKILKQAEAALQKVKLVRYQAEYQGTGWVKAFVADVKGSATMGELSEYDIPRFHCKVKLTLPDSEEALEMTAGSDGNEFFLIDPKSKTVYMDMDDAVLGTHQRNMRRVFLDDFVVKEPLAEDLKAEKVEVKGTAKVGDEECHEVQVTRTETQQVTWFISKKDHLPRRVVRAYTREGEVGTTELVMTDLVAGTTFEMKPFKVTVPEGFRKTDDFAP